MNNLIAKNLKIFLIGLLLLASTAVQPVGGLAKDTHVSSPQKSRLSNLSLKDSDFNGDQISDPIVKVSTAGKHLRFGIRLSGQTNLAVISLAKTNENPLFFAYDADKDGDTDIVAEYLAAKSKTIFLNDGQGKFEVSSESYFHDAKSSALHDILKNKKDSLYFNFLQRFSQFPLAVLNVSGIKPAFVAAFVVGINLTTQSFLSSRILLFLTHAIRRRGPPII